MLTAESLERRDLLASDVFIGGDDVPSSYVRTLLGNEVTYSPVVDSAQIGSSNLSADLTAGRRVVIDTINAPGTQLGDVFFSTTTVAVGAPVDATLEVRADNDVLLQGSVLTASPGQMTVILNSDRDAVGGGRVAIDSTSTITTNGGDITIGGGVDPAATPATGTFLDSDGVFVQGNINASAGNILIRGQGVSIDGNTADADGIRLEGTIDTTTGDISLTGFGGDTQGSGNDGVTLDFGLVGTNSGNISIVGTGGGTGSASGGVVLTNSGLITAIDGTIDVAGTGAAAGNGVGVLLATDGDVIESLAEAPITISGLGAGGAEALQFSGSIGGVTASGDITLVGDSLSLLGGFAFLEGTGNLTIRPLDPTTSIGVGGGSGTLNLSDAELGLITDGFNQITIGDSVAGTGAVVVDSADFFDPVTILGGSMTIDNGVRGRGGVTLVARDEDTLGQDFVVNSGAITDSSGNITLQVADDLLLSAGASVQPAGATSTVAINVDQAAGENVGSTLTLNGELIAPSVSITATSVDSGHRLLFGNNVSQAGIIMSGPAAGTASLDIQTIDYAGIQELQLTTTASDVVVTSTTIDETINVSQTGGRIDVAVDNGQTVRLLEPSVSLTINTGSGLDTVFLSSLDLGFSDSLFIQDGDIAVDDRVRINGPIQTTDASVEIAARDIAVAADVSVGDALVLGDTTTPARISIETGNLAADSVMQFDGSVDLFADVTATTSLGPIFFSGAINGAHDLSVTSADVVSFSAAIGNLEPLNSISVISGGDRIALAGDVTTSGPQKYAASLVVDGDTDLAMTSQSDTLTFDSSIDDQTPGQTDLTIRSSGSANFASNLGGSTPLGSITIETAGPFSAPGLVQASRDISITVRDSAVANDTLDVPGRIRSQTGNLRLAAGDELSTAMAASLEAPAGGVAIVVDGNTPDPDPQGATVRIDGVISSAIATTVTGGANADRFELMTRTTSFEISGGDPSAFPGDVVVIDAANSDAVINLGSGALTVAGSTVNLSNGIESLELSNVDTLSVIGTSGDDAFTLSADASRPGTDVLDADGLPVVVLQSIGGLILDGGDGDDQFTLDASVGLPAVPVVFHGRGQNGLLGGDRLGIVGTLMTQVLTYDPPAADGNRGTIDLDGTVITYTGLEPIDAGNSNETVLNLTDTLANNAVLRASSNLDAVELIDLGSSFEDTRLPNPSSRLTINLGNSGNRLEVAPLSTSFAASLIINGGAGNDDVQVNGVTLDGTSGRALDVAAVEMLEIVGSTFRNNVAENGAGLRILGGQAVIENSMFVTNTANDSGGGIFADGATVTISNSSFVDNVALGLAGSDGMGGGIGLINGDVLVVDTLIESNSASAGRGGGIGVRSNGLPANLTLRSSTLHDNTASLSGGGIAVVDAGIDFENVTIVGNQSLNSVGGGLAYESVVDAQVRSIRFSTITANNSLSGGSNLDATGMQLEVSATIFDAGTCGFNNSSLTSLGFNLDSGLSCGLSAGSDIVDTDPLLDTLQDNGGPVPTTALLSGSPAIDGGPMDGIDLDARGFPRPEDGDGDGTPVFDIGAFEAEQPVVLTVDDVIVDEDVGSATVTVRLSADVPDGFTVDVATSAIAPTTPEIDYTETSDTLTFSGMANEIQTFTVAIIDDLIVEPSELIRVILSNPSDTGVDTTDDGVITIVDNDFARLTPAIADVREDVGVFFLEITLDNAVQGGFSVIFATNDGTATQPNDYVATSGTLNFDGFAGESKFVPITIIDDDAVEPSEQFTFSMISSLPTQVDTSEGRLIAIDDNDTLTPIVRGHVFCDANGNAVEDAGEEAVGVVVFLDGNRNGEIDLGERTTSTDASGDYRFNNVRRLPSRVTGVTVQVLDGCNTVSNEPNVSRFALDVGDRATSIISADVDGDRDRDLLVTGDLSGTLTVLENDRGHFRRRNVVRMGDRPQSVAAFETASHTMFAVASIGQNSTGGGIHLLDRTDLSSGTPRPLLPAGDGPIDVVVDDFNNDQIPDIAAGSFRSSDITVYLSGMEAGMTLPSEARQVFQVAAGNLDDSPSTRELVVAGIGYDDSENARIEVFALDSSGGFARKTSLDTPGIVSLQAADVAGDLREEVIALSQTGVLSVYEFDGNALELLAVTSVASGAMDFALGDFNFDGKQDVAIANSPESSIDFLVGDDSGRFVHAHTVEAISTPSQMVVDDLNGDGFDDLAVTNYVEDASRPGRPPRVGFPSSVTILLMDVATRQVIVTADTIVDFGLPTADPAVLFDVSGNQLVTAHDALLVINQLNRNVLEEGESPAMVGRAATDVNGDGRTSAVDALMIINHLAGEGDDKTNILDSLHALDDDEKRTGVEAIDLVLTGDLF